MSSLNMYFIKAIRDQFASEAPTYISFYFNYGRIQGRGEGILKQGKKKGKKRKT